VLKKGGLMDHTSNPGDATPESLHKMYSKKAATTGNPTLLRDAQTLSTLKGVISAPHSQEREFLIARQHLCSQPIHRNMVGNMKIVSARHQDLPQIDRCQVQLTLNSLNMKHIRDAR
jgi:hypothetical protein